MEIKDEPPLSFFEQVYQIVEQVPYGSVITYGQVAMLAGRPRHARQVGYALHAAPKKRRLPWHRVVNRLGELSPEYAFTARQRELLEKEGVTFNSNGLINMKRHLVMAL
ncbi:methylated-DNA--[protein]-cysteine S-methyltransferase [Oxalobacter sp. OttesenSCG-928-P03]|nr:methylated-DNA--[protein]-cysteine S-methyltransferase [Oxalobacter sp. OttesenSCG-928-P03]